MSSFTLVCGLLLRQVCGRALLFMLLAPAARAQALIGTLNPEPFYHWQHPRPVGELLVDLHVFNDSAAVALSNTNYAVRTTDRGQSWRYLAVGSVLGGDYPQRVTFVGDTLGWIAQNYTTSGGGSAMRLQRTLDGGRTWATCLNRQFVGGGGVLDVQFVTRQHGFLLYWDDITTYLARTTDGGQTWAWAATNFGSVAGRRGNPLDLHFVSPTEGWVACGAALPYRNPGQGSILHTTNSGATWQPQTPLGNQAVEYVAVGFAPDGQHGWAFSTGPSYRTTDGGRTWTAMNVNLRANARISVLDAQHVTIGGAATSDGGVTWVDSTRPRNLYVRQMMLAATGRGWGLGLTGGLFRTTAYGQHWPPDSAVDASISARMLSFEFPGDARRGWARRAGDFPLRTTTAGRRWTVVDEEQAVPADWRLNGGYRVMDVATVDFDTATALVQHRLSTSTFAYAQDLLRTTDGGQTWQVQALPAQAQELSEIAFYNSRHGCAVGNNGTAYCTHDGGQTWQAVNTGTTETLTKVSWASPTRLSVVFTSSGTGNVRTSLLISSDGGQTWQAVPSPAGSLSSPVAWRTPTEGWLPGTKTVLYRSTDGGISWAPVPFSVNPAANPQYASNSLQGITFLDSTRAVAADRRPLYSADNGRTWTATSPRYTLPPAHGLSDRYNGWFGGDGFLSGASNGILHYSEKFLQADTALVRTTYCAGETLALAFARTGTFGPAEQAVVAELSDAHGRFGRYPQVVGQGTASPLAVRLPAGLPAGTGYLLRVSLPDHSLLGGDNQYGLTIHANSPAASISPAGPMLAVCAGGMLTLAAPLGQAQYLWSTGATTQTISTGAAGTYTVRVAGASGCLGLPSPPVTLTVVPLPAPPVVQLLPGGQLSVSAPVAGATYQWLLNAVPIAGATQTTYPTTSAAPAGTYTVVATVNGCASLPSAPLAVLLATAPATVQAVRLYPNPARTTAWLERLAGASAATVELLDITGRVHWRGTVGGGRHPIPVHDAPTGIYFVRVLPATEPPFVVRVAVEH